MCSSAAGMTGKQYASSLAIDNADSIGLKPQSRMWKQWIYSLSEISSGINSWNGEDELMSKSDLFIHK